MRYCRPLCLLALALSAVAARPAPAATPGALPPPTPIAVHRSAVRFEAGPTLVESPVHVRVNACGFQQFWVLPLGNTGATLEEAICNGRPGDVAVGDVLAVGHPGNPNHWYAVLTGIQARLDRAQGDERYAAETAQSFSLDNPRVLIVPIVEAAEGETDFWHPTRVRVVELGALYLLNPIRIERGELGARDFWLDGVMTPLPAMPHATALSVGLSPAHPPPAGIEARSRSPSRRGRKRICPAFGRSSRAPPAPAPLPKR